MEAKYSNSIEKIWTISEHNFCNFLLHSEYDHHIQSYTGVRKKILVSFYAMSLSFFYTKLYAYKYTIFTNLFNLAFRFYIDWHLKQCNIVCSTMLYRATKIYIKIFFVHVYWQFKIHKKFIYKGDNTVLYHLTMIIFQILFLHTLLHIIYICF